MKDLEAALRKGPRSTAAPAHDFTRAAEKAGLLDIGYASADSPFGPLVVAATTRGLVRLAYPNEQEVLEELAFKLSPRLLAAPKLLDPIRRQLDDYFEGKREDFDVPIDWSLSQGFVRRVLRATARIPFGSVSTYKDVARRAGSERGARAAGNALGSNPIPIVVPCHRVLHTGGGLGGYTGGLDRKRFLLSLERAL